jgi:hypothetical protein
MNPKRLIIAIVAVFLGVWVTDFFIHGVWLKNTYAATMSLWRPEAEMRSYMGWLTLGQFLASAAFVLLWAAGFASHASVRCALLFGLFMGLALESNTLVMYAVQPLPADLAVKWFIAGLVQTILMAVLVLFVYKPKAEEPQPAAAAQPAKAV